MYIESIINVIIILIHFKQQSFLILKTVFFILYSFKMHQLQSQLNQVSIQLQKASLKFQHQLKQEKSYLQKLKAEKNHLFNLYRNLNEDYQKIKMLLQAERESKKVYCQKYKELAEVMVKLKKILNQQNEGIENILQQIETIMKNQIKNKQIIQQLTLENQMAKRQYEYQLRIMQKNRENKQKQIKQDFLQKIIKLQQQNKHLSQINIRIQLEIKEMTLRLNNLEKQEKQKTQELNNVQSYKRLLSQKSQEVQKLKVKLQMFNINKSTLKEQRYKFDQQTEQLKFKLQILQKKIQLSENRLKQTEMKNIKLQESINAFKQKQRQMAEKYIEMIEQNNEIKKKLHIWQIYREKYKQNKVQNKEINERADYYQSIAEEYANQVNHLQIQVQNMLQTITIQQKSEQERKQQIENKNKQLLRLSLLNNHQIELINQKNEQIKLLRHEIDEKIRKLNLLINNNIQQENKYMKNGEEHKVTQNKQHVANQQLNNQQINQLINHYRQILDNQNKIRTNLQNNLTQKHSQHLKLKLEINQLQLIIIDLKEENKLIKQQQNLFIIGKKQKQRQFQEKLKRIKQKYDQAKIIQLQSQNKKFKKLRINKSIELNINPKNKICKYQTQMVHRNYYQEKGYGHKLFRYGSSQQLINLPNSMSKINMNMGKIDATKQSFINIDLNSYKKSQKPLRIERQNIQKANKIIDSNKILQDEIKNHKNSKEAIKKLLNIQI